ncbi:hypothetical protein DEU56DRAFT_818698 [Suillus clintonianus]|uniref:uncharacterized protein n=1 Tax=Suillus clintonianus TaxID=1904413 RepID=UPI001B87E6A0|nr:uncharacterized protein DEU56DRAFT_818698 [Suillus clintonianus]KAG2128711.1 hypothetical protein DEU56DRAFT_818698 [Suillus clintonianus]
MATWILSQPPWLHASRVRLRLDVLPPRVWSQARNRLNASLAISTQSPSSIEVEHMPLPRQAPDMSVFEEMTTEYTSAVSQCSSVYTPQTSSATLVNLIRAGDYAVADSLRKEMVDLKIPIQPHTIYERAARAVLQTKGLKNRAEAFSAWLSLVPTATEQRSTFKDIRQQLFRGSNYLNISLVMRFGLAMASKGYLAADAQSQVLSTLARYASPATTEKYLCQLETAVEGLSKTGHVEVTPEQWANIYSLVIRNQLLAGRAEHALQLTRVAATRGRQVTDFTFKFLLEHSPDEAFTASVHELRKQISSNPYSIPDVWHKRTCSNTDTLTLASRLRYLRRAIISKNPPTSYSLSEFMNAYHATGRTRALLTLRKKAFQHSHKAKSLWVMAEMLYHRSRNEPQLTLVVFAYHFHMIGVPRRTILKVMRLISKRRASLSQRTSLPKHMLNHQYDISEKLWPTPYHTALVWEALVWSTQERDHERMYKYLLAIADSSTSQTPISEPGSKFAPSLLQLPKRAVDAAHFSPFIKLHAKRGRPEQAAGVLGDMVKFGLRPGVVQWSIVARGFAEYGDPAVAVSIIERLEEDDVSQVQAGTSVDQADRAPPILDIGLYTNVLRGFVLARRLEHAQDMERRIRQRFEYVDGELRATDDALHLLRNLERQTAS